MADVLERKENLTRPLGTTETPVEKGSTRMFEELSESELAGYASRKHGDLFSGMYFDDATGSPEWGTYGLLKELPSGLNPEQVKDFLVQGGRLDLVKKLSPDLQTEQKEKLKHIPGWKREEQAAELSAQSGEPIVPQVEPELSQPDTGITYTPVSTEPANAEAQVAPDNIAGLPAKEMPPGAPIEKLKSMIKNSGSHVEASQLAAELHKQARNTPETKS